ncbi:MAG: GIY-YIG nuclease family protein [Saprospiraceae bacterium]|nr:GIY-YIG nuclease family protein [Saprospiraceae bacterium]MBK9720864.1 GIY-YIG nuclease family protein [Saprospiraceae bacterium]
MDYPFTVYVLYSSRYDKIYIGYTNHLIFHFHSHNQYSTKDWTKNFRPWFVVYTEIFSSKAEALQREKELKSYQGRQFIRNQCIPIYFSKE